MISNHNNNKEYLSVSTQENSSDKDLPNSSQNNTFEIYHKEKPRDSRVDPQDLLRVIKATAPISKYKLSKITKVPYSTLTILLNQLEYLKFIKFRTEIGWDNKTRILIVIDDRNMMEVDNGN